MQRHYVTRAGSRVVLRAWSDATLRLEERVRALERELSDAVVRPAALTKCAAIYHQVSARLI